RKRVRGEGELGDRAAADQVLLDDALERIGCAAAVPRAVGGHQRDRAFATDPEAVRLRAVHAALGVGEAELAQALLQERPRCERIIGRCAVAVRAEEDVPAVRANLERATEQLEIARSLGLGHGEAVYGP